MDAIRLRNLTLTYQRRPAIHHLSGTFPVGVATAILGPNGAGKSTLLKALVGLVRPHHGDIEYVSLRREQIAYLPQQAQIEQSFPMGVLDAVTLGDWPRSRSLGRVSSQAGVRALDALARVGLRGLEAETLGNLSAGQFQRVLFARILMQDAPLILLDEPFSAVDQRTTLDLLGIVDAWGREGRTVICVLHDDGQVRKHFPQALLLARECIAWGATASVLSKVHLNRANGVAVNWDGHTAVCHIDDGETAQEHRHDA